MINHVIRNKKIGLNEKNCGSAIIFKDSLFHRL